MHRYLRSFCWKLNSFWIYHILFRHYRVSSATNTLCHLDTLTNLLLKLLLRPHPHSSPRYSKNLASWMTKAMFALRRPMLVHIRGWAKLPPSLFSVSSHTTILTV